MVVLVTNELIPFFGMVCLVSLLVHVILFVAAGVVAIIVAAMAPFAAIITLGCILRRRVDLHTGPEIGPSCGSVSSRIVPNPMQAVGI